MGNVRVATFVFLAMSGLYALFLAASASSLPPTLATHFDASGAPNSWMSSSSYLIFSTAFGLGVPGFIVAVFYMTRWLPASLINIPQRNFWLAGERASQTHRYLLSRGLWLGGLMLVFLLAIHYVVIRANQLAPPQLAPRSIIVPVGILIIGLAIGIVHFVLHFTRAGSRAA